MELQDELRRKELKRSLEEIFGASRANMTACLKAKGNPGSGLNPTFCAPHQLDGKSGSFGS